MSQDPDPARFHFTCPECGFGDDEWGHLGTFEDSVCMVCHMDDGRIVRLRRWHAEEGRPEALPLDSAGA